MRLSEAWGVCVLRHPWSPAFTLAQLPPAAGGRTRFELAVMDSPSPPGSPSLRPSFQGGTASRESFAKHRTDDEWTLMMKYQSGKAQTEEERKRLAAIAQRKAMQVRF